MEEEASQGGGEGTAGGACARLSRPWAQHQALCPKGHLVAFQNDSPHTAGGAGGATASGPLPITGPDVRTQRVLNPLLPEPSCALGWPDARGLAFWVLLPHLSFTLKNKQGQ